MDVTATLDEAVRLRREGRIAEAERLCADVLRAVPNSAEALNVSGAFAIQAGDLGRALLLVDRALTANPRFAPAHHNRGVILRALGCPADALASFETAIVLRPEDADAYIGRGIALHEQHRLPEAAVSFARAVVLDPKSAAACLNLGKVMLDLGRLRDAIVACDQALALAPDLAEAKLNKSLALLTAGAYAEGFRLYEFRDVVVSSNQTRGKRRPRWTGTEDIAGKTIFVFWEQGLGDTIQFCRYLPRLSALGAHVVASVQEPLRRLLAQFSPCVAIVGEAETPGLFDYATPLLSLPLAFGETLMTLEAPRSYLSADKKAASRWRARLEARPGLKVGLVWAGGPKQGNVLATAVDERRSLPLSAFDALGQVRGVSFISLQKGRAAEQVGASALQLFDATDELADFADTAALVEALDLVVSVDTAVAHLAAALGKPVWILNRFGGDWRWLEGIQDSPWYPTVRLFRQPGPGAWAPVIGGVVSELMTLVG